MSKTIKVDYMARVEGEASVYLEVEGGALKSLTLDIFEPPRFFEGFLVGRKYDQVPDLVARICGICPAAHMLTAIMALENAMGIEVSQQVRDLRRLLAMAQTIQSHALSIYMLSLPDFLGYESAVSMAAAYPEEVKRALRLKKLGNDFTALIGGRAVHPVTAVVGGFTRIPPRAEMEAMAERLEAARDDAMATVRLVAGLKLPGFPRQDIEHAALRHESRYPVNEDRLISTGGLDIRASEYRQHIREAHVPPSHALWSSIVGRGSFMVGPLPRLNLNLDRLSPRAREALELTGLSFPNFNPFASIVARAVEIVQYIEDALDIIRRYEGRPEQIVREVRAGTGAAFSEAPRGLLYHGYTVSRDGLIEKAEIVSPTAHNAHNIEQDLKAFVPTLLDRPEPEIQLGCEMLVRAYDPCFSCSAHFLKLNLKR